jgi:ferrous iron transport protein A
MTLTLADMSVGDQCRVIGIEKGIGAYRKKLLAMGLVRGTEFKISRVAPMGDPVEIEVRGYNLSLRKSEATALYVEGV